MLHRGDDFVDELSWLGFMDANDVLSKWSLQVLLDLFMDVLSANVLI